MRACIYYNSWDNQCKSPFGAVQVGTTVEFALQMKQTDQQPVVIELVICKEGAQEEILQLVEDKEEWYRCSYRTSQTKGLYFYYFQLKVSDSGEIFEYYGHDAFSGEAKGVKNLDAVKMYQLTNFESQDPAPQWYREAVFYQIFPDRFSNGNIDGHVNHPKPNSFLYATEKDAPYYIKDKDGEIVRWDFQGGNLAGIRAKIPYLQELGVNALYLNPIFEALSNHRYDTSDYHQIDAMLGTNEEFLEFVQVLHEAGFHLILDGVFSHVGKVSRYFNSDGRYGQEEGAAQSKESAYYPWFKFTDYPTKYKSWWGVKDLPEVDKENVSFQKFIYGHGEESVISTWGNAGIDGWRLDVADELPDTFIQGIRENLNRYEEQVLIGEVWEDASNKIAYGKRRQYTLGNQLHGVMNYPVRNAIINLLQLKETTENSAKQLMQLQENYPRDIFYNSLNSLGTHDTERIFTILDEDMTQLFLAVELFFMMPGTPCVYYGDEMGVTGGKDPENRKFFPWSTPNSEIFAHYSQWTKRRKSLKLLQNGSCVFFYSKHLFGILRTDGEESVVYVVNPQNFQVDAREEELVFLSKTNWQEKQIVSALSKKIFTVKSSIFWKLS
ncbi:MAG: glycoside hydrolase family 13 protein [Enterococcus sp.]